MSDEAYWPLRAACRRMDATAFELRAGQLGQANRAALAACARCPVRAECRDEWAQLPKPHRVGFIAGGVVWRPSTPRSATFEAAPAPAPVEAKHGTRTRYDAGCRCPLCRQVKSDAMRAYRHRSKAGAA